MQCLNHRDTMPVVCAASPMDQHASCKPSENSASGGILIIDKGHLSAFSPSSPAVIFGKGCFVSQEPFLLKDERPFTTACTFRRARSYVFPVLK